MLTRIMPLLVKELLQLRFGERAIRLWRRHENCGNRHSRGMARLIARNGLQTDQQRKQHNREQAYVTAIPFHEVNSETGLVAGAFG